MDLENLPYDESGNLPRGDNGQIAPPAEPAENTAATPPSPDPAAPPAIAETKTGDAVATEAPGTTPARIADTTDDAKLESAEEATLKEKYSRPTDKGDEWQIRAYRDGEKLKKSLTPVQEVIDRIGSPDRARRGLELTADLADPDVPIANAVSKMTALSSSRFQELHDHLYTQTLDQFPDRVAADLVEEPATLAELKEGLKLLRSGARGAETQPPQSKPTTTTVEAQKPADMSDEDWEDFKLDYPAAFAAMQAQAAKAVAPPAEAKEPELSPAEQQLKALQDEKQQEWVNKKVEEISAAGQQLHDGVYEKVVETGLRDLGLVPDPAKDDPKTIQLKERTAKRIRDGVEPEFDGPDGPEGPMDYSLLSEEQKLNRRLTEKVMNLLAKGDIAAARDYEDRIAAQVDLAFQRVVEAEIDLYNAAMLQSTGTKQRDATAHTRPELVGGTAPGGATANKTPWLDPSYRRPGESGVEAMNRYYEEQAA